VRDAYHLARTRDWVVVYFHTEGELEGQRTIVTETGGPLTGQRVVRGRESECQAYYASRGAIPSVGSARYAGAPTPHDG